MRNSKLFSILERFNKIEQNRFRKFLQSPYFNSNQAILDLFEILISYLPENGEPLNEEDIPKEEVWEKLGLEKEYDDVRFRKYCSDLLKLVESFLAQQLYEENALYHASFLIEAVGRKKLSKLYNSTMKNARRLSEQFPHRSSEFFFHQYKIERNYYQLTEFETKRTEKSNAEDMSRYLDYFYFAEKLRIYCGIKSQKNVISHEYNIRFIEEIVSHLHENPYDDVPAIALYYQTYLTYEEPENEEHYYQLKRLLDQYALDFPHNETKEDLYMSALNYCVRKINQGNQRFLKELFILYQDLLKKEILFAEGELSPWYFRNIVVVALRLGEYTWTENFIKSYQPFLPEEMRRNVVTYNLAQLYLYQKKYDKVIEQLQYVEYEDVTYNLNSKTMLLATYYELDEIEPLYSLLESFRVYLNRHKDIETKKRRNYLNLVKFTKKLTKIIPGDKKALEKLKSEIDATKGVVNASWLKEKIAELE